MKNVILTTVLVASSTFSYGSEITLSKGIKENLRDKIEKDLSVIDNIKFQSLSSPQKLKEVMGISSLNSSTANEWLNQRVNYVISENALSLFSLLIKRVIYKDRENVDFPNADVIPYSLDKDASKTLSAISTDSPEKAMTVMSNIGSALYYGGKSDKTVYGMRISRGFLKASEKVAVNSPRVGIIQIGEGLFSPDLMINKENANAFSNTIFRLGTFFHEARHSDGNGKSLGFMHATCPKGHDYEGKAACDENLNGPYSVGSLMMAEMAHACEDSCSEKEKQVLKLMVLDSANRIQLTTHKGEKSTIWDATPESL